MLFFSQYRQELGHIVRMLLKFRGYRLRVNALREVIMFLVPQHTYDFGRERLDEDKKSSKQPSDRQKSGLTANLKNPVLFHGPEIKSGS